MTITMILIYLRIHHVWGLSVDTIMQLIYTRNSQGDMKEDVAPCPPRIIHEYGKED
jgi:hypothetical protein